LSVLPDWGSVESTAAYSRWFAISGLIALAFVVVFDVLAFIYAERKDVLISAEAHRKAEEDRRARIQIEDRIRGWRLDEKAQQLIIAKLQKFPGTPFNLYVDSDPKAVDFLETIDSVLLSSGWKYVPPTAFLPTLIMTASGDRAVIVSLSGILIHVPPSRESDFTGAARALASALLTEGIESMKEPDPQASPDAIHIKIGKRP
jgi:hypothetical protein